MKMQAPALVSELPDSIQAIRRHADSFTTNLFAARHELQQWLDDGVMLQYEPGCRILLLRRDGCFHRLYHVASVPSELHAIEAFVHKHEPRTDIVADLIGTDSSLDREAECYRNSGFEEYTVLLRMALMTGAFGGGTEEGTCGAFATSADVFPVTRFLDGVLDPFRDRVPAQAEVVAAVERSSILVARDGEEIEGLLWFEHSGATSLLRYWYVAPGHLRQGIGGGLMQHYLKLCSGKRRILVWVVRENALASAIYRHYGFREDGLVDRILLRKRLRE
ncbi:MAG: GNAT family N-acetyltransferase [Terracidiphilus sp.]